MGKNSRKKTPPPSKARILWAPITLVLLVLLASAWAVRSWSRSESLQALPDVSLEEMEPQVAAKVTEHFERVRSEPESAEAWGRLGMVLHAHGLEREAAQCYEQAIALDEAFPWQYLYVHALRSFDAERAFTESEKALALDSSYAAAHIVRGELLEERGEAEFALDHYQKAVALDASNPMAAFAAGRLLFAQGELEAARELLMRAAELDPEAGAIHGALAQLYRRMGDREKAIAEATLASGKTSAVSVTDPLHFEMRNESVSSIAQLSKAQLAARAGDFSRAESIYRDLVELRPEDADMQTRLGDVLLQRGRIDEAAASYRRALEIHPEHPGAHYGLGNVRNTESKYEEAARHYRLTLESRPDHVPALVNLGSLAAFRGDFERAESLFREALAIDPTAFGPRRQLGQLYLREKKFGDAVRELERALDTDPEAGPVHLQLAIAYASMGEPAKALEHTRKARTLGVKLPDGMQEELERRTTR